MKCINNENTKNIDSRNRRKRQIRRQITVIISAVILLTILMFLLFFVLNSKKAVYYISDFESENYKTSIVDKDLISLDLCVAADDVKLADYTGNDSFHGQALFDVADGKVIYSNNMYDKLYPASTTKILTAYVTLKYGNLDDIVTVSETAVDLPFDAQVCSLQAGDSIKLYDLLCGLMLYSGNDAANAIGEHISGSVEAFVDLMNEEALKLGATHTHFVNPHGLHDENHYTTVYDLYLMFNACIKYDEFNEIYSNSYWTCDVTGSDGSVRSLTWEPTNWFSNGASNITSDYSNKGGKTGTTDEAGSCLVLSSVYLNDKQCISIIMGADNKDELYSEMNNMLDAGKAEL